MSSSSRSTSPSTKPTKPADGGRRAAMSLVWIFRLRDGQIAVFRDYFAELPSAASAGHPS